MKIEYFESNESPLVKEFYHFSVSGKDLPFKSTIVPLGFTHLTYSIGDDQKAISRQNITPLKGLMVTGPFFRSYQFLANANHESFGMSLHPSALYKILSSDTSLLENRHIPLKEVSIDAFRIFNPIYEQFGLDNDHEEFTSRIQHELNQIKLTINKQTEYVDRAIEIIWQKEGLLLMEDILSELRVSQKTLESQFKKIVGLTPGKYTRLYRFLKLMKRYNEEEINLTDLIYMYNYYDRSHFIKDFKLFMDESPTSYFQRKDPLAIEILKKKQ